MYSQIKDKIIGNPMSLPFRITLYDGSTRTSLHELTNEQLAEIGIYSCVEIKPEYDSIKQYLGEPKMSFEGKTVTATYPVLEKTEAMLEADRVAKIVELAQARYQEEISGFPLADGTIVKTDEVSQAKLTGLVVAILAKVIADNGLLESIDPTLKDLINASLPEKIDWCGENGWVQLGHVDALKVGLGVTAKVQTAFSTQKAQEAVLETAETATTK